MDFFDIYNDSKSPDLENTFFGIEKSAGKRRKGDFVLIKERFFGETDNFLQ